MKSVIDIHSHILPCVDDGCSTREETLRMLREYEKQNVEAVICTPHDGPYGNPLAQIDDQFKWLSGIESDVNLYLGSEVYFGISMNDVKNAKRLADSDFILVEFDTEDADIVLKCKFANATGLKLIVAHPERYLYLRENLSEYVRLALYADLQINAYDICEGRNSQTKKATQWLLENQLVSYIGSDSHGYRRPPHLHTGVKWIYDHCPKEYADAIVHDNAAKIIRQGN